VGIGGVTQWADQRTNDRNQWTNQRKAEGASGKEERTWDLENDNGKWQEKGVGGGNWKEEGTDTQRRERTSRERVRAGRRNAAQANGRDTIARFVRQPFVGKTGDT